MTSGGPLAAMLGGYSAVKSNALLPTEGKLTGQYLVAEGMLSHIRKMQKIKPVIDTKEPVSWRMCSKAIDQRNRALRNMGLPTNRNSPYQQQHGSRSRDRRISHNSSEADRQDIYAHMFSINNNYDGKYNTLNSDADIGPIYPVNNPRRSSPDSYRDVNQATRGRSRQRSGSPQSAGTTARAAAVYSTINQYENAFDLLNAHGHVFTEPSQQGFTPRTLKTNATSMLTKLGLHNPPRSRDRAQSVDGKDGRGREDMRRQGKSKRQDVVQSSRMQDLPSDTLMSETLVSRDDRPDLTPDGVPQLAISLDHDNICWQQKRGEQNYKKYERLKQTQAPVSNAQVSGTWILGETGTLGASGLTRQHGGTMDGHKSRTFGGSKAVKRDEDDLAYLEFLAEVTTDVLDRGIFTNKVLKQVFDSHVARRKDELDESTMHRLLDDLRRDLQIPITESGSADGYGFASAFQHSTLASARYQHHDDINNETPRINKNKHRGAEKRQGERSGSGERKPPLPFAVSLVRRESFNSPQFHQDHLHSSEQSARDDDDQSNATYNEYVAPHHVTAMWRESNTSVQRVAEVTFSRAGSDERRSVDESRNYLDFDEVDLSHTAAKRAHSMSPRQSSSQVKPRNWDLDCEKSMPVKPQELPQQKSHCHDIENDAGLTDRSSATTARSRTPRSGSQRSGAKASRSEHITMSPASVINQRHQHPAKMKDVNNIKLSQMVDSQEYSATRGIESPSLKNSPYPIAQGRKSANRTSSQSLQSREKPRSNPPKMHNQSESPTSRPSSQSPTGRISSSQSSTDRQEPKPGKLLSPVSRERKSSCSTDDMNIPSVTNNKSQLLNMTQKDDESLQSPTTSEKLSSRQRRLNQTKREIHPVKADPLQQSIPVHELLGKSRHDDIVAHNTQTTDEKEQEQHESAFDQSDTLLDTLQAYQNSLEYTVSLDDSAAAKSDNYEVIKKNDSNMNVPLPQPRIDRAATRPSQKFAAFNVPNTSTSMVEVAPSPGGQSNDRNIEHSSANYTDSSQSIDGVSDLEDEDF